MGPRIRMNSQRTERRRNGDEEGTVLRFDSVRFTPVCSGLLRFGLGPPGLEGAWPTGKYPRYIYGGDTESIGDWAYVHECRNGIEPCGCRGRRDGGSVTVQRSYPPPLSFEVPLERPKLR